MRFFLDSYSNLASALNLQIEELEAANQRLTKEKEQRAFQFEAQEAALRKIRQERDELKSEDRALRADLSQLADKLEAAERRAEQLQKVNTPLAVIIARNGMFYEG